MTEAQIAPIEIEVEYLSTMEISQHIDELLWNFRRLFLPRAEELSKCEDRVSEKEYARYERESDQAWSALEAAFQHETLFTRDFLSDNSVGALERVTSQLLDWAHGIQWPDSGSSGIWKSTAHTADECCELTSTFMQDKLWPFTKIIR